MKKKIKLVKYAILIITGIVLILTVFYKLYQMFYLNSIEWNLVSYSPLSILMIFFLSLSYTSLALLDRAIHKNSLKNPSQLFFLISGIIGMIFSFLLIYYKAKEMGWIQIG